MNWLCFSSYTFSWVFFLHLLITDCNIDFNVGEMVLSFGWSVLPGSLIMTVFGPTRFEPKKKKKNPTKDSNCTDKSLSLLKHQARSTDIFSTS